MKRGQQVPVIQVGLPQEFLRHEAVVHGDAHRAAPVGPGDEVQSSGHGHRAVGWLQNAQASLGHRRQSFLLLDDMGPGR